LSGSTQQLIILTVCTGNICRSPAVEHLLRRGLGPTVEISSAGTSALVGQPVSAPMAQLLLARKVDSDGFRARLVSAQLIEAADLVLPVTRAHRSLVVDLWPAAVRRTFTVREFARLLLQIDEALLPAGSPAERLRAAIPLATAQRGRTSLVPAADDDVVDPYRRERAVYEAALDQILPAVQTIVQVATGRRPNSSDRS
jgi:protein-tyrosine phosphatase